MKRLLVLGLISLSGCSGLLSTDLSQVNALPMQIITQVGNNCDIDISFGGVALAGNIKCSPHPVPVK